MRNELQELMIQKMPELTESQRKIADYIIKNPLEISFLTVEQLAEIVGTSTTTIVRLSNKLGYSGYAEFQRTIQSMVRSNYDYFSRLQTSADHVDKSELLLRCSEIQIGNIRSTVELLSNNVLDSALAHIHEANRIYCTGIRSGLPVAQYLDHGISRLFGNCELIGPDQGNVPETISGITPSDLVIVVAFPRYARNVIDFAKQAKAQQATVIGITDGYSSPLVDYADLILPCGFESIGFHNSIIGGIFIADCLISAIVKHYPERANRNLEKLESILASMNYHYLN